MYFYDFSLCYLGIIIVYILGNAIIDFYYFVDFKIIGYYHDRIFWGYNCCLAYISCFILYLMSFRFTSVLFEVVTFGYWCLLIDSQFNLFKNFMCLKDGDVFGSN